MIQTEFYRKRLDGINLIRSYSDRNMKIIQDQTGNIYDEAIDVENSGYSYTETDIPIESPEISDTEALNILLGRENDEPSNGV